MFCLAKPVEKEWQVVMIVQLFDLDLPGDSVALRIVFKRDREVATLVELSELGGSTLSLLESASGRWSNYFDTCLSG